MVGFLAKTSSKQHKKEQIAQKRRQRFRAKLWQHSNKYVDMWFKKIKSFFNRR
jgi:hypothetical protein